MGAVAGMIAESIMHPLDTLNTRLKIFAGGLGKFGNAALGLEVGPLAHEEALINVTPNRCGVCVSIR